MYLRVYDASGALKNTSANFSDAEIKTKYENNADTNEFSDAEQTDLASMRDNSMVDALHRHSELSASDGAPDAVLSVDATGIVIVEGSGGEIFVIRNTNTNNAVKVGAILAAQYDSDAEPEGFLTYGSLALNGVNKIQIGGGFNNRNAATAIEFYTAANSTTRTGTIALTIDSSQNAIVETGNLIIGTAGKGIDFSATSDAAGSTSELFDDHEKGTFTGTLDGDGGGGTPIAVTGYYEKSGDMVFCDINFTNKDTSGMTGVLQITGFPYTAARATYGTCWVLGIVVTQIGSIPIILGTTINIALQGDGVKQDVVAATGRYIRLAIAYRV